MTTPGEDSHETAGPPKDIPPRHGEPWTEEDYAGVMRSCRAGRSHDGIARDIGRSPKSLRGQLRRMLPAEERHLPPDVVLSRLRQLDEDGDYDWLAAMSERSTSAWEWRHECMPAEDARELGSLTEDQVLSIAVTALFSTVPLRDDLQDLVVRQIWKRCLEARLQHLARGVSEDAVTASLHHGSSRGYPDLGEAYGEMPPQHEYPGPW